MFRKCFILVDHEESLRAESGNTNEDVDSLRHTVANLEHNLNNSRQEIHDKEDRIKHLVSFQLHHLKAIAIGEISVRTKKKAI
jgi:septal ring factor EnvC (AmiA/AmiB activator)